MLEHMEELAKTYPSIKPDFHCYNVYIFAILEATNHGHMNNAEGALICQNFLEKMLGALDDMLSPDTWTFNMVLNAWSRSGSPEMVDRADHLISMLERYHDQSGRTAKTVPNSNTYNTLLSCYSRSTFSNKTDRAYALFQKMKNLYLSGENLSAKPDAITYNIIMNMFAKTKKRNSPGKCCRHDMG